MRHPARIAAFAIACGLAASASAQHHPNRSTRGELKYVVGDQVNITDSVNAYRMLGENQPVDNDFLNDPTFAIIGRDNSFYFSIGANLKFTASADWGNPCDDPGGVCVASLTRAADGDDRLYQMTANGSNLYLNIIGFPTTAHRVGLFMSLSVGQTASGGYNVNAGHIYMRYRDLTFGYTSSLYNDNAAEPYSVDSHGPIASGGHSNIQANWQRYVSRHVRVGIGIEAPKADYTAYQPVDADGSPIYSGKATLRQRVPDVPFYVNYSFTPRSHVRLSGIVRSIAYRDLVAGRDRYATAWGLKLTTAAPLGRFTLYGMAQAGHGTARYLQENRDLGLDLTPDPDTPGRLKASGAWGVIAALQYNWRPDLYSTAVYSYMRNYVDRYEGGDGLPYDSGLCYGNYAMANLIWQISPLFRAGLEWVYGQRVSFDRQRLADNRLAAMFTVTF